MTTEKIVDAIYRDVLKQVDRYIENEQISIDWTVKNDFDLNGKNIAGYKIHFDTDFNPSIIIIDLVIGLIDESPLKCNLKQIKAGLIVKLHEHFKV